MYSVSKDFKFTGGVASVVKMFWKDCKDKDSTFATRPTKLTWTDEMDLLVRNAITDGELDLTKIEDMQLVICYQCIKYFLCRGIDEITRLEWTRFVFGIYDQGELAGIPMVQLKNDIDKTNQITISNHTLTDTIHRLIYVHNSADTQSFHTHMVQYRAMCPPEQQRFFCRPSTVLQQKNSVDTGRPAYQSSPLQPHGKNRVARMVRELARRSGVVEWKRVTNHAIRAYGITRMNNSASVSIAEAMGAARHRSTEAHKAYVKCTGESELNRIKAMSDVPH